MIENEYLKKEQMPHNYRQVVHFPILLFSFLWNFKVLIFYFSQFQEEVKMRFWAEWCCLDLALQAEEDYRITVVLFLFLLKDTDPVADKSTWDD